MFLEFFIMDCLPYEAPFEATVARGLPKGTAIPMGQFHWGPKNSCHSGAAAGELQYDRAAQAK